MKMKVILILSILLTICSFSSIFKPYPLANDYFDIIYNIKGRFTATAEQKSLFLRVYCKQNNVISVSLTQKIQFQQQPRFPVYSQNTINIPKFQSQIYTFLSACNIQVRANPRPNSIVQIIRKSNNQPIFELSQLTLSQGHNKFTVIDKSIKWGLGQRFQQKFKVTQGHWTIWNRDKPWEIDHGQQRRSSSSYGHQPLYLARQKKDGYTHLTYFKNTHGMLIQTTQQSDKMIYNSLGGNIHFIIFVGDKNPQKTIQIYHDFIGGIHIPPFWALGWHQCRWGYKDLNRFKQVIQGYQKADLPLDTMWNDLDYMQKKAIFTIDQSAYPSKKLKALLQDKQLHYIPLIDVGVSLYDQESMKLGKQLDVFLKDIHNPLQYYTGQVWPGAVHFVDYLHPNASYFWKTQLNRLYKKIPFSGIWLDMNQPSNFRGNQRVIQNYRIQHDQSINMMTIDVNLKHFNYYNHSDPLTHWQVHSYYGHTSTIPTFDFLKEHNGRPFIISRSNSVGTGMYAGHWTGDNQASWDFLRLSISGNFLYQIFGIQMVGADICGFHQDTNNQLCSRWTQLGSLYPFARNHNQDIAKDQQPYALGKEVLSTAKVSIKQRYSLLKQLYSILVDLGGQGSFFRPVYFQFYQDNKCLQDEIIQTQFLLGSSLLSAPMVQQSQTSRSVYFPGQNETWHTLEYDIQNPGVYMKNYVLNGINRNSKTYYKGNSAQSIINEISTSPPLFLRSGHMIFSNTPQKRSRLLNNRFFVTAALNSQGISRNKFLTIKNYQNQAILGKCIQNHACMTEFTLKRIDQKKYELKWQFEEISQKQKEGFFGEIELVTITIWSQQQEWVSKEKDYKISTSKGSITLQVEKH